MVDSIPDKRAELVTKRTRLNRLFLAIRSLIGWRGAQIITSGRESIPSIGQQVEHQRVSADRIVIRPMKPARVENPSLWIVPPEMSAIEYIVETSRPGEVEYVDDWDYHNAYLWRSYKDFNTG
jgi:hypothetical protein